MPPIMGAAAFLMAEFTGIPYGRIAVMAILPAILYFTGIFIAVHLEAKKMGMKGIPKDQLPKPRELAKELYLLLPLIALIYLVVSRLAIEGAAFARDLPALIEGMTEEIRLAMSRFEGLFLRLPEGLRTSIYQITENMDEYVGMVIQRLTPTTVSAAGSVAKGIPGALVYSVVIILSSYFFIVEREGILRFCLKHMPESGIRYYKFLKSDVKKLIGGYFLAQFRIMFVVALILAAGLFILQVKYSFLWAVLIAILDFLPVFGTGTVLIPWAVIKVFSGEYAFAAGLALIYILTQVVRQIIQPKIVGDTVGLPPLTTLFFLYLGYKWAGLGGMILAVPIGMLVLNLYEFGAFDSLIDNLKILVHDVNEFRKKKE